MWGVYIFVVSRRRPMPVARSACTSELVSFSFETNACHKHLRKALADAAVHTLLSGSSIQQHCCHHWAIRGHDA